MPAADNLLPASFRGVPFKVEREASQHGRRVARHVAPQRDIPTVEDLGRRPREYSVEGYLIGDDYLAQRRTLEAAFERRGPGVLVHPTHGQRNVQVEDVTFEITLRELRFAKFTANFVEAGTLPFPLALVHGPGAAAVAGAAVSSQAETDLAAKLIVKGVPEAVRAAAATAIAQVGTKLQALELAKGTAKDVAALAQQAKKLVDQAAALVLDPPGAAGTLLGAIALAADAAGSAQGSLNAYLSLLELATAPASGSGSTALAAASNSSAVIAAARAGAAAGAVEAAANVPWETRQDAERARDEIAAALDELIEGASDEQFEKLSELRAALVGAVPPADQTLPSLRTIVLRESLPSEVLAYSLYGDVEREPEIVARNRPVHPSFMPAGDPLEVLTDA